MTELQKRISVFGLVVIALTLVIVPYRYSGIDTVEAALGRDSRAQGLYLAPIWRTPMSQEIRDARGMTFMTRIHTVELAVGQIGLLWTGIVLAALVGMILAATTPGNLHTRGSR